MMSARNEANHLRADHLPASQMDRNKTPISECGKWTLDQRSGVGAPKHT